MIGMVCQPGHHSGLPSYLKGGFEAAGERVAFVDARARWLDRAWPAALAFHPDKQTWLRRRWEKGIYSVGAWHRNTRRNGVLLDALKPVKIFQIGANYFPNPEFRNTEYFLFITYTLHCALRDGVTPWLPPEREREEVCNLEAELFSHAAHVFTNAQFTRDSIVNEYGVSAEQVSVAGMGVDDFFLQHRKTEIPSRLANNMVFVGWDFGMKGGPVLLKAFAIVRNSLPGLTLTIVGPPPGEPLPGIVWAGRADRQQLLEYFRKADLFVMPSLRDSFGFVFLEAMSQGLPCLGTTINAMPDIIGDSGFVVPPRNERALADAILKFYADDSNRRRLGELALARVRERFTWAGVIERMLAVMGR